MTNIPYVAIGNNELGEETETIYCPRCKQDHPIEYGTSKTLLPDGISWSEPVPSKSLGFYTCQGKLYLGTVEGRRWKSAAELRRLHAENIELKAKADVAEAGYRAAVREAQWQASTNSELNRHMREKYELRAQRDALLEALQNIERSTYDTMTATLARAAIAKVEGQQ